MSTQSLKKLREVVRREHQVEELDHHKTALMFVLERKYGKDIVRLISRNDITGTELARELNISRSLLSKWRKRFGVKARPHPPARLRLEEV